jgi:serine/threonine protein kinase
MSAINGATANLLMGCLEFDKNKRIRAETIADHPAFNIVREKISRLMREVERTSQLSESQLRRRTPKGQYYSYIMSFNFISEVAIYLGKKNNSNLASLYLLKYTLAEANRVKKEA